MTIVCGQALNASMLSTSRRWISTAWIQKGNNASVMVSAEGCVLACINNYVWIDTSTGFFPSKGNLLQPSYACIPCTSEYILQSTTSITLYSVWNASQATVGGGLNLKSGGTTVLSQMQGKPGSCFTCPTNTDTIEDSDIPCQSPPGYGQPVGTPVTVAVNIGAGVETGTVISVPSVATPVINPSTSDYFLCCNKNMQCKTFTENYVDTNQASFCPNCFYSKCIDENTLTVVFNSSTTTNKKLLSVPSSIQACFTGQYNLDRGDTTCYACPLGLTLFLLCHHFFSEKKDGVQDPPLHIHL